MNNKTKANRSWVEHPSSFYTFLKTIIIYENCNKHNSKKTTTSSIMPIIILLKQPTRENPKVNINKMYGKKKICTKA